MNKILIDVNFDHQRDGNPIIIRTKVSGILNTITQIDPEKKLTTNKKKHKLIKHNSRNSI